MILHLVFSVKLEEMRDEMGIAGREKYYGILVMCLQFVRRLLLRWQAM